MRLGLGHIFRFGVNLFFLFNFVMYIKSDKIFNNNNLLYRSDYIMVIYVDLLIILNFIYDFLILKVVSIVLKRNIKNIRIIISSLIGELSIILLVFNFNYIILLISKIMLALIMNIIAFKYKNIKFLLINLSYFYMISIILGGFIYFLHIKGVNYIVIMILIPLMLILYIIQNNLRHNYNNYYDVIINYNNNHKIKVVGYLDTGNNVVDPISLKPVIIISKNKYKEKYKNYIYVNVKVLNNTTLIKCIKPKYIEVNKKVIKDVLIGIIDEDIKIDGVDCLLNNKLRKEIIND